MFRVNLSSFNHLDFLWGRDARTLVYSKIQSLMGEYSHSVPAPITLHRDASKSNLQSTTPTTSLSRNHVLSKVQSFTDNLISNYLK
ncbi:hypothetical protein J6590_044573 [Homalodisca vitripennis]|nr:hypothetical protein J6590_092471 [Homalodisca vitripennis]KAG8301765.1 hypothetical protein J6590_044573 [Homalodisca vitripennis]